MKQLLIVHPEGNINNNPNLSGITQILCENGYIIDILLPKRGIYQFPPCDKANLLYRKKIFYSLLKKAIKFNKKPVTRIMELVYKIFNPKYRKYALIIGIDRQGVIEASLIANSHQIPLGLISYEIFFADEAGIKYKELEKVACKKISFAVCQDELRSYHLSKENEIPLKKIIRIPVAGRGVKKGKKQYYLHNKLKIENNKKIALIAGAIEKRTMVLEIISTLDQWPQNWVLVLHNRYGNTEHLSNLIDEKRLHLTPNVYFSNEAFPNHEDMRVLFHSVDLGIALNKPTFDNIYTGKNIKYLGLSSGKISTYLQHGLPVITNEIGKFSDYIRKFNLGIVILNQKEIPEILQMYDINNYTNNCFSFFEQKLDLNKTIKPLLQVVDKITKRKNSS